mmetsp:Transcript_112861/g.319245  ORF Transcript_112861/g.319245 Transcript_112861/m.319245 type:complete len:440 (-) Transcript_112861:31-1350(-)
MDSPEPEASEELRKAVRLAERRVLPLTGLLLLLAYVARGNVAFTATAMERELGFTDSVYGFSAGIFFVAYAGFQVPANMVMLRLGPRLWLGCVTCTWALLSAACGLVSAWWQFPLMRFALGLAEAGLAPGLMLYLTHWFPPEGRALAMSRMMLGAPLAVAFGAPISELILHRFGWRWLFLMEAAPVLLVGVCLLRWVPSGPEEVSWLSPPEKEAIASSASSFNLDADSSLAALRRLLCMRSTWGLGMIVFAHCMMNYGVQFFMPKVLERCVSKPWQLAVGIAVPNSLGALAMIIGCSGKGMSDRAMRVSATTAALTASAALAVAAAFVERSPWISYFGMAAATPCIFYCMGPLMAYVPNTFDCRTGSLSARALGIAVVNGIGHIGAFLGPYLYGSLDARSKEASIGVIAVPGALAFGLWGCCGGEQLSPQARGCLVASP